MNCRLLALPYLALLATVTAMLPAAAQPVALKGEQVDPNAAFGKDANYRLIGDATFGWKTKAIAGDIDLNGHTLTMDTGGGNTTRFSGSLSGAGTLAWSGGTEMNARRMQSYIQGQRPNAFTGTFALQRGLLILDKPAGTNALAGPIQLGSKDWSELRWGASNQLADAVDVTFASPGPSILNFHQYEEKLGQASLQGDGQISLGARAGQIRFADSREAKWLDDKQLLIVGGGAADRQSGVWFGASAQGLSDAQIAQIGFLDPAGKPAGLYRADINNDGRLVPAAKIKPIDPPFDMSPQAIEKRRLRYEISGIDAMNRQLRKEKEPVTISLFGDSITWQDGYASIMRESIASPGGIPKLKLVNRGINGGGVKHLLNGADGLFNQEQPGLAEILRQDQPRIAVFFIGINDATWIQTSPDAFREGLIEIVRTAKAAGVKPILATLTVQGELPDGKNPIDKKIDRYAKITREVAAQNDIASIDLRSIYMAYLKNHNSQLRLDGSVSHRDQGLLTYDRVHPTAAGNKLLAEHISAAIAHVLSAEPR